MRPISVPTYKKNRLKEVIAGLVTIQAAPEALQDHSEPQTGHPLPKFKYQRTLISKVALTTLCLLQGKQ